MSSRTFRAGSAAIIGAMLLQTAGAFAAAGAPGAASTATPASDAARAGQERVVLAGGCFWGMQAVFNALKGVHAVAGYAGGAKDTAHYEMVSTGETGHAESVSITYDPTRITFGQLLAVYFLVAHDPTELDRQGPDEGSQYRSEIFYTTDAQRVQAEQFISKLEASKTFGKPIVTRIAPLGGFYPAEDYHQDFVAKHPDYPYVVFNDKPKLENLRKQFPQLLK